MIFGVGTDIIEIERIKNAIKKNDRFMERMFTPHEIEYYKLKKYKAESVAAGFAAKEAVLKSLGTGLSGFTWKDIEILRLKVGKPIVRFNGAVKAFVELHGIGEIHISISHSRHFAVANAVAELSLEKEGQLVEKLLLADETNDRRSIH